MGQLYKNTWLIGGNLSYSKTNAKGSDLVVLKSSLLEINTNIGYFLWDRFAAGLVLQLSTTGSKYPQVDGTVVKHTRILGGAGPVFRYYFLQPESRVNLLTEASLKFLTGKQTYTGQEGVSDNFIDYNFLAGPVIFFNSSVGMEFLVGYNRLIDKTQKSVDNKLKFTIGLQFHLERE